MTRSNFYNELGLPFDATAEEIRSAYFQAAKQSHPDTSASTDDQERFLRVQDAFQVLSDPNKRAEYDATLPTELSKPLPVEINVLYSLPGIPHLRDPQRLYAILEIHAPILEKTTRPAAHICLVIDRSTSMQGERISQIKQCLSQVLPLLKPDDLISVVAFSDRAETVVPPVPASRAEFVENSVRGLYTQGATEIFQGLKAGYQLLLNQPRPGMLRHLVLLTDGHTYGDEQSCYQLAEEASAAGISISGLGFGHEWNDEFLDRLTAYSGEQALFVLSPKDLYYYFEKKLLSFDALVARSVRFFYETGPRVCLEDAFRLHPSEAPVMHQSPMVFGDLTAGKSLRVLLEFTVKSVSPDESQVEILTGKLVMDIPDRAVSVFRVPVRLDRIVRAMNRRETIPGSIMQAVSRLTLYRMQAKARAEVDAGLPEKAAVRLRNLATHLLAQGEPDLANTIIQESEHLNATQHFSDEGAKRIKYGTRSLFLLPNPEHTKQ